MNEALKIALIAIDVIPQDKDKNLANIYSALEKIERGTDIVVLPELFSTGFIKDPEKISEAAEPVSGKTVQKLHQYADKFGFAIAGSFLCKVENNILNRGFFIEPGGDDTFYDKKHLFSLSPEKKLLNPGYSRSPIIRYRGWNISMIICYDLRFPAWCRNINNDYDLLLVPANWPNARAYAWKHLLIARAIENQAYIAGANRSGKDNFGDYDNLSFVFNPTGEPIGEQKDNTVYATLRKKAIEDIRKYLPVINDADVFEI